MKYIVLHFQIKSPNKFFVIEPWNEKQCAVRNVMFMNKISDSVFAEPTLTNKSRHIDGYSAWQSIGGLIGCHMSIGRSIGEKWLMEYFSDYIC